MRGADCSRFPEILDDIEEALDAQENLQELFRIQMVAEGAPHGREAISAADG